MESKQQFSSLKVPKPFLLWLKVEAAKKGISMYEYIEQLVWPRGKKPWEKS